MPNYNIVTDSCCDLRPETYEQLNLTVVPLSMEFRGQVREDRSDDSIKEVYAALRAGESAQTAAVNPDRWLNAMEPHLAAGRDVLVMAFSSVCPPPISPPSSRRRSCGKSIRSGRFM